MLTNSEKLSWMAGFFDGEGYVGIGKLRAAPFIARGKPGWLNDMHFVILIVTNNELNSLMIFKEYFGGKVLNKINPLRKNGSPGSTTYTWSLTKKHELLNFLTIIEPYCVIKGPQVYTARYFMSLPRLPSKSVNIEIINKKEGMLKEREELYLLMKDLKNNPTTGNKVGNLRVIT